VVLSEAAGVSHCCRVAMIVEEPMSLGHRMTARTLGSPPIRGVLPGVARMTRMAVRRP
jgi:hypothetical protein